MRSNNCPRWFQSSEVEPELLTSFIVHKPLSIILGLLIFTTKITINLFLPYPVGPEEGELKILLLPK